MNLEAIRDAALGLEAEDREYLAAELLGSLGPDPSDDPAWAAEIQRRLVELDRGEVEVIDMEQAEAEI